MGPALCLFMACQGLLIDHPYRQLVTRSRVPAGKALAMCSTCANHLEACWVGYTFCILCLYHLSSVHEVLGHVKARGEHIVCFWWVHGPFNLMFGVLPARKVA